MKRNESKIKELSADEIASVSGAAAKKRENTKVEKFGDLRRGATSRGTLGNRSPATYEISTPSAVLRVRG